MRDWEDFPIAVLRKPVIELAGPREATSASNHLNPDLDCLIGEMLRRARKTP